MILVGCSISDVHYLIVFRDGNILSVLAAYCRCRIEQCVGRCFICCSHLYADIAWEANCYVVAFECFARCHILFQNNAISVNGIHRPGVFLGSLICNVVDSTFCKGTIHIVVHIDVLLSVGIIPWSLRQCNSSTFDVCCGVAVEHCLAQHSVHSIINKLHCRLGRSDAQLVDTQRAVGVGADIGDVERSEVNLESVGQHRRVCFVDATLFVLQVYFHISLAVYLYSHYGVVGIVCQICLSRFCNPSVCTL